MISTLTRFNGAFLAVVLAFVSVMLYVPDAEAKRFGGGGSFGRSSGSLFGKKATPPKSSRDSKAASKSAAPQNAAGSKRSGMMGMLGGLAAGLGLAALFSALGFGEGLASILGILLMVVIGIVAIRFLFKFLARQSQSQQAQPAGAYAGSGGQSPSNNAAHFDYQQPSRDNHSRFEGQFPQGTTTGGQTPANLPEVEQSEVTVQLPADFDEAAFLQNAKQFFTLIQAEFDKGDLESLKNYCTDEMGQVAAAQIEERKGAENNTTVVSLEAELVGYEVQGSEQVATVAYQAMIREEKDGTAQDIHEHWVLVKPSQGGWMLAGIHSL